MAQGDMTFFEEALEHIGDGTFDMDNDTWNVMLITDTPPAASTANPDSTSFTEVTAGGTYSAGGSALANVTWSEAGGIVQFNADDVSWLQNASNPTNARCALVYSTTAAATDALCYVDLGAAIDMSAGDLTIEWNVGGIFSIS